MEFVYQIDNVLSKDVCEDIIKRFTLDERKRDSTLFDDNLINGRLDTNIRKSKVLAISSYENWKDVDKIFFESLSKCLEEYKNYLDCYTGVGYIYANYFKGLVDEGYQLQYMKNGDFYKWHADQGSTGRFLTCIWYLSDVDINMGGTTDFLFGKKIVPKQGSVLIFPSSWTYIHRAAPVTASGEKYTCITWLHPSSYKDNK